MPFRALNSYPVGMTAHIVYEAYDKSLPATISPIIIDQVIRRKLGFDGLLLTDDLSMKALKDPFDIRAKKCLDAGCDIVLHCNGDMTEMLDVAKGLTIMTSSANRRWKTALTRRKLGKKVDVKAITVELDQLLS